MSDFDSQLPIRSSATDAHIDLDTIDGNAVATGSGTATSGTLRVTQATDVPVNVDLDTLAGTAVAVNTGTANNGTLRVTQATDVPVNTDLDFIASNAVEAGYGTVGTGSQRVAAMLGVGSTAVSSSNPVPVNIVGAGGVNQHSYSKAVNVGAGLTDTHSFTPSAPTIIHDIYYSASGQMKAEIQWGPTGGETTRNVGFTSKGHLNGVFHLTDAQLLNATDTLKIIRTNTEPGQSQDLYSSIHGILA